MLHIMNQKKEGSEGRAEQTGGNIMDKGRNEAERWRAKGEGGEEERGEPGGEQREGSKGICLAASFSHAPPVPVRITEATRERWRRRGAEEYGEEKLALLRRR